MNAKSKGIVKLLITVLVIAILVEIAVFGIGSKSKYSAKDIGLGLDLAGGVSITYEAVKEDVTQEEMDDTVYKMQLRVSDFSMEAVAYQEGDNRINIDIPGVTNAQSVLKALGKAGTIYYIYGTGNIVYNTELGGYELTKSMEEIIAAGDMILDGSDISTAEAGIIPGDAGVGTKNIVNFKLTEAGAEKFAVATTKSIGRQIAIVYDDRVVSAPVVNVAITGGEAYIEGMSDAEEAKILASTIRIGALPIELKELRSSVVGATLGHEAVTTSLLAAAIGFALVVIFMIVMYRIPGVSASLALFIYAGLMVFLLNFLDITLTLSGMAGIILSIGMAVDANVIIFQRIREEIATGKTVQSAMKIGFKKANSAIIDGNITTLIAAMVLYAIGTGSIQGFAITLALGIILSMFTALFVTRFILYAFYDMGCDSEKVFGTQKPRKVIDFVKRGKLYGIISGSVIALGIAAMILFKVIDGNTLNYGLDFMGGTSMTVTLPDTVTGDITGELEKVVSDTTNKIPEIVNVSGENTYIIKTVVLSEEERSALNEALVEKYNIDLSKTQVNNISGTVSGEMRADAIKAVLIATVGMLLYIWIRFKDLRYAASAVIALTHDVLVVLTVYAVSRISVGNTFIACMLTLVGYSINATIVVFDRIRENLANKLKKESFADIANRSITETLSRSINTSLTTLLMILMLALLGVDSIREFALPLMVGLLCGTYSSVCIAGTLWYFFKMRLKERVEVDYEKELMKSVNSKK